MLIHLHKQATTTPKVRAVIQASREPASVLAERFGTTEQTIYKWRHRDSVLDRSHTAHRLQTTLTSAQEAVATALRKTLLVSLDDLLAVVREFDLLPEAPSFITRVRGSGFHILRGQFGQARRARSPQIAQAHGALLRVFGCPEMSAV
jgi:transposase-like protein